MIHVVKHQLELLLGEVRIHARQGDAVKCEIPGGIPGILPLVGHRNHVVVHHVIPLPIAQVLRLARNQGIGAMLFKPLVQVEVIVLLRPQHAGHGLAHHESLIFPDRRRA